MRTTIGSLTLAALLAAVRPAAAADVPCESEMASFCSDVKPGDGRIISCLKSRWPELSTSCRDALDRASQRARSFVAQCELDLFRFCRTTPISIDATLACLGEHASELDADCKPAYQRAKARPDRIMAACKKEVPILCGSVDATDGPALAACLAGRARELSSGCAATITP
jgi:hypothetical protein